MDTVFRDIQGVAFNFNNVGAIKKKQCCLFEEQYVINLTLQINTVLNEFKPDHHCMYQVPHLACYDGLH